MTDERPKRGTTPDPANVMQSLFPGLAWTQAMMEGTQRAQAAFAADTLKQLNAPVVDALKRHRDLATALAETSKQMAAMANRVEDLARQHAAISGQLQAAMEPYLRYVDWLEAEGKRQPPTAG
jgi:septal ring factor EnvC (AmiA/AmiB activator)